MALGSKSSTVKSIQVLANTETGGVARNIRNTVCLDKDGKTATNDTQCHGSMTRKCEYRLRDLGTNLSQDNFVDQLGWIELGEHIKLNDHKNLKSLKDLRQTFVHRNEDTRNHMLAYACTLPTTEGCPNGRAICPLFEADTRWTHRGLFNCDMAFKAINPHVNLDRYKQYLQGEFCYFNKNDKCPIYTTHTKNAGSREYYDRQKIRIPEADASSLERAKEFARGYVEAYQSHECTGAGDREYKFAIHRISKMKGSKDLEIETVGQCKSDFDKNWDIPPESYKEEFSLKNVVDDLHMFFLPQGQSHNKTKIKLMADELGCKGEYGNGMYSIAIRGLNGEELGSAFVCASDKVYRPGTIADNNLSKPDQYLKNTQESDRPELAATMAAMACTFEKFRRYANEERTKDSNFRVSSEWMDRTMKQSKRDCGAVFTSLHKRFDTVPAFYLFGKDKFDPKTCRDDKECKKKFIAECTGVMNASQKRCDQLWYTSVGDFSSHLDFEAETDGLVFKVAQV